MAMGKFSLLINILGREFEETYLNYYKKNGVNAVFSTLCLGTASKSMLDYLGLERNEKVMLSSLVSSDGARKLLQGLVNRMGINLPGTGIAITIPVGSIAGNASLMYLAEGQTEIVEKACARSAETNEVNEMKEQKEYSYALITVIAEKGCSDMVMDAARAAGAGGGTVVHAKGTATEFTAKFFGVSIAADKEMIYIVTRHADKDAIMRAVVEKAGPATDARAAVFSLPVEDVVGLCSVMDKEDE